jgi:hypothetical protein
MECKHHSHRYLATLYWAGTPGNAGAWWRKLLYVHWTIVLLYWNSVIIRHHHLVSRWQTVRLENLSSVRPADERGIITNKTSFVLGPSGSDKSFFITTWLGLLLREQGARSTGRWVTRIGIMWTSKEKPKRQTGFFATHRRQSHCLQSILYRWWSVWHRERESVKTWYLRNGIGDEPPTFRRMALSYGKVAISSVKQDDICFF